MPDPLSIVTSAVSFADVIVRVTKYIQKIRALCNNIDVELDEIASQIRALELANDSILAEHARFDALRQGNLYDSHRLDQWRNVQAILHQCTISVQKLEELLKHVLGEPSRHGRLETLKRALRRDGKEEDYKKFLQTLGGMHGALQTAVQSLQLTDGRELRDLNHDLSQRIDEIARQTSRIDLKLDTIGLKQAPSIRSPAVGSTPIPSNVVQPATAKLNKHFSIPQAVSNIYTGRIELIKELKDAMLGPRSPSQERVQKRFVVCGMGGAGKTQLCCKFAQEYRESFWGIFYVDASSKTTAKESFGKIARIAGVDANEEAAKDWLTNLDLPWLLIIDSLDDPQYQPEDFFPQGDRGHVLITTKNPEFGVYGTAGCKTMNLRPLLVSEADDLLLKAASKPLPGELESRKLATKIAEALGYLPLALIHAGRAILRRLCTLEDYLDFYRRSWQRIRGSSRGASQNLSDDSNLAVYVTWEISFNALEQKGTQASIQAVELLKVFSFIHHADINLDVLKSPEKLALEEQSHQKDDVASPPMTWNQIFEGSKYIVRGILSKCRDEKVTLPSIFNLSGDFEFHLANALRELTQLSLISHNPATMRYDMHSLTHAWIRNRPQMSVNDQLRWCQIAANTIARPISMPPHGETESDGDFRRSLLPHLECLKAYRLDICKNMASRPSSWATLAWMQGTQLTTQEAIRMAKFSRVYQECGQWSEAAKMQETVHDYVKWVLGPDHKLSRSTKLFLAGTYWSLGRPRDSVQFLREILQSCLYLLGEEHPDTLVAMDLLGAGCWQLASFDEALALHSKAFDTMKRVLGPDHEATLRAMGNMGRDLSKYRKFTEAQQLHGQALNSLRTKFGPKHPETLVAMDNLAMAIYDAWTDDNSLELQPALDLMVNVLDIRKHKLGREHPYTLWAMANLAKVQSALGMHDEAETLLRTGVPIARRNLGEDHIGTLFGRSCLAQALIRQDRYAEAEAELADILAHYAVMEAANACDGIHPDRVFATILQARCFGAQGRAAEGADLCRQMLRHVRASSNEREHPFERLILVQLRLISGSEDADCDDGGGSVRRTASSTPTDGSYSTPLASQGPFPDLVSAFTKTFDPRRFAEPKRVLTL